MQRSQSCCVAREGDFSTLIIRIADVPASMILSSTALTLLQPRLATNRTSRFPSYVDVSRLLKCYDQTKQNVSTSRGSCRSIEQVLSQNWCLQIAVGQCVVRTLYTQWMDKTTHKRNRRWFAWRRQPSTSCFIQHQNDIKPSSSAGRNCALNMVVLDECC